MIHYYLTKGAHKLSAVISVHSSELLVVVYTWVKTANFLPCDIHWKISQKKKHTLEIQNDFTMCSLLTLKYMFSIAFSA
jgi:hypothetical protein